MRRLRLAVIACIMFALPVFFCANAYASTLYKYMTVSSDSAPYYSASNLSTDAQIGTLTMGDEVRLISKYTSYSKIKIGSEYAYIQTKDLDYRYVWATGSSQKLYKAASTKKGNRGYVIRGTKVKVLGVRGSYYYVSVPKTYTGSTGSKVKYSTAHTGYIKKSAVKGYNELAMTEGYATLYKTPSLEAESMPLLFGEKATVLFSNEVWSKVTVNGNTGFIKNTQLTYFTLDVVQPSVSLRKTTSSSSKLLKTLRWMDSVQVLYYQTISGSTYAYVNCDGTYGFVLARSSSGKTYLDYGWHLIASKDTDFYILGNDEPKPISKGARVYVVSGADDGYRISAGGVEGFVDNEDLESETGTLYQGVGFATYYDCSKKTNPVRSFTGNEATILAINFELDTAMVQMNDDGSTLFCKLECFNEIVFPEDPGETEDSSIWYIANNTQTIYPSKDCSGTSSSIPYRTAVKVISGTPNASSGKVVIEFNGKTWSFWSKSNSLMHELPNYQTLTSSPSEEAQTMLNLRQMAVSIALDFAWNLPNVYDNNSGCGHGEIDADGNYHFMCSGFTAYCINNAFRLMGISHGAVSTSCETLNGSSYDKYQVWREPYNTNQTDGYDNLRPGDVLLFYNGRSGRTCTHAALYLGNGDIAHTNPVGDFGKIRKSGVVISKINGNTVQGSTQKLIRVLRFF